MKAGTHYLGDNAKGQQVFAKISEGEVCLIGKAHASQASVCLSAGQAELLKDILA